jgi:hypothetical protein
MGNGRFGPVNARNHAGQWGRADNVPDLRETTWVGLDGLRFSWLDEPCSGRKPPWKAFVRAFAVQMTFVS